MSIWKNIFKFGEKAGHKGFQEAGKVFKGKNPIDAADSVYKHLGGAKNYKQTRSLLDLIFKSLPKK